MSNNAKNINVKRINMDKIGKCIETYKYIFINNKVDSFNYYNKELDKKYSIDYVGDNKYCLRNLNIDKEDNNSFDKKIICKMDYNISDLDTFLKYINYPFPELYHDDENDINIKISNSNLDYNINLNKENFAVKRDKQLFVYKYTDDLDNLFDHLLEIYYFADSGFFLKNKEYNTSSLFKSNFYVSYNLFKKKENIGCLLLDQCPTYITYYINENYKEEYNIKYDKYGMVEKITDKDNPEKLLVRSEVYYDEDEKLESILSLHPSLYDPFSFEYVFDNIWCLDTLYFYDENNTVFERKVYKLNQANNDKLLKLINKNIVFPLLIS